MDKNDVINVLQEDSNMDDQSIDNNTFFIGEKVFIRTITWHHTGRVKAITRCFGIAFLWLEDAAWIASDGRFTQTIEDGILEEVEPIKGIFRINISSIIDVCTWKHPLPRTQIPK